ncbi:MAG: 6-phosphogluconolactonase [Granulosicoccaceae bacterium]
MSTVEAHSFRDRDSLFEALQQHLVQNLNQALSQRQRASLAVSGGSTPAPLYRELCRAELDWSKVTVTLTDERYVPTSDKDSNEAMLKRTLLTENAATANFVPLMHESSSAEQAAAISHDLLQQLEFPLDTVILGMGNDMHTASLFPDAPELAQAMSPAQQQHCMALQPASSPYPRLSMSLNTLLNSREIILLICGHDKQDTLDRAKIAHVAQAPIAAVLKQDATPVHIYWSP